MAKKRSGKKKWWQKNVAIYTAIGLGIVAASIGYYFYVKKNSMGRMGLYIPAPTVKKYPAFAGTQYYN